MPKATRGQLRSHSRSSSATKLGANLQLTQKEPQQVKTHDKPKKGAYAHEAHPPKGLVRANSTQLVQSREQLTKRLAPLHQHHQPPPKGTNGHGNAKGFSIAIQAEQDDEDEWISSESGAATPNREQSDSDTASEADALEKALTNLNLHNLRQQRPPSVPPGQPQRTDSTLQRVQTARPSDFEAMTRAERNSSRPTSPVKQQQISSQLQPPQPQPPLSQQHHKAPFPPISPHAESQNNSATESRPGPSTEVPRSRHSPRLKRHSRPPSMHSGQSKADNHMRPHPLIRAQSYGMVSKPSPLAPLTVVPTPAPPQISTSPGSIHENNFLSSSPTSAKTSSGSPRSIDTSRSPFPTDRRGSFSSARSVNTIPVHSTIIRENPWTHDRTRTLSTMSASSSSAALSSLAHIPNVTRPPSPQSIVFFPPVNPHANIEGIHPLLPSPYLHNHLSVLSRRTPIRESFDRVIRAKNAR